MNNSEIIYHTLPDKDFAELLDEAVRYALISLPFTIDRMNLKNPRRQIKNIAKGKIAEKYFKDYAQKNGIKINFNSCTTPFWQVDKRDFKLANKEWDLKNNFIYHDQNFNSFLNLPALIPNRHSKDQWDTRNETVHHDTTGVNFLFTFMKGAPLIDGSRGRYFFDIDINQSQIKWINSLVKKYQGKPKNNQPFNKDDFWEKINSKGPKVAAIQNFVPKLIITGYSCKEYWDKFRDTGPYSQNNYKNYNGNWYRKVGRNDSLKFLNGEIWTTITNATVPVEYLPSFSLFVK